MRIITKKEIEDKKEFYFSEIKKGKIFVYPTDTIYGIGCDALNDKAVLRIRKIKNREEKPFSIIAPSKEWIVKNCFVDEIGRKWLDKLPGAYTLILKLQNKNAVAKEVNDNSGTLGVRIPANWFAEFISSVGAVFVTTSVNLSGEKPINSLHDLKGEIKKFVDYFVDYGELKNPPSTVVNLIDGEKVVR